MDGDTLRTLGFDVWRPFRIGVEKEAPQSSGVYAFRSLTRLALVQGMSDIKYIGRAMSNQKGPYHNIQHSIREYLHPVHLQATMIGLGCKGLAEGWEVSWMVMEVAADTKECELLRRFYNEHGQLPPENKRWPPGCWADYS